MQPTDAGGQTPRPERNRRNIAPLTFKWEDNITELESPENDPLSIGFRWGNLKFTVGEVAKIRRLRPYYGDKVDISVSFRRGRLREANEEHGSE